MTDELGKLMNKWRMRQMIFAVLLTIVFIGAVVMAWFVNPSIVREFWFLLFGLWAISVAVFYNFGKLVTDSMVRPIVSLGRDYEAQLVIGRTIPTNDYQDSMLAALASTIANDAPTSGESGDGDRNFLEELIQTIDQSLVVVGIDHRVLLINDRARETFASSGGLILGGRLTDVFDAMTIDAAIIRQQMDHGATGERLYLSETRGHNLIPARLKLLTDSNDIGRAYVISVHDSARALVDLHGLERAFDELMLASRGFAQTVALRSAVNGDSFLGDTVKHYGNALHDFRKRGEALTGNAWPKSRVSLRVFADLLTQQLPSVHARDEVPKGITLRCDAVGLIATVERLIDEIDEGNRDFTLSFEVLAEDVKVILCPNEPVPITMVEHAQSQALAQLPNAPTGEEVMRAHNTEIWPHDEDNRGGLVFRLERVQTQALTSLDRAEFYDFNPPKLHDRFGDTPLAELPMVVFDTETTGLDPAGGDQVVSISAVRVHNGRVIASESFDQLVNPGRSIPRASTEVHGVTNAMVADAPPFDQVLADFHDFANGATLVAHNAAFDMAFVRKTEAAAGVRFDQPVLDTVFMSAFLYDHVRGHTLDDLAVRLDVTIPEQVRHTALGDAIATAEILTRMIPILSTRGVERLDQMLEIGENMRQIRRQQRQYGG